MQIFKKGYEPVTIVIYNRNNDARLNEISLLAIEKNTNKVISVGEEARKYIDDDIKDISVVCPLRGGIVADYTISVKMFQYFIAKALGHRSIFSQKPKIAVCVPVELTEIEKIAFRDSFYQAGAKDVLINEIPFEKGIETITSDYKVIVGIIPYMN
ncbi:MAG: rod shape-determining protein [Lachnotalea sp.]